MHQWIRGFGLEAVIIATKADKITRSQINVRINDIRKVLELDKTAKIIPFSSLNKLGLEATLDEIERSLNMVVEKDLNTTEDKDLNITGEKAE